MEIKHKRLRDVIAICQRFNQFDPKMQVSTILTLLEIARAEELKKDVSPQDLEKVTGLQSGTMTRNVYYWAEGHKDVVGSHMMVDVSINPTDRRRRSLKLTPKGRAFINSILDLEGQNGQTEREQVPS